QNTSDGYFCAGNENSVANIQYSNCSRPVGANEISLYLQKERVRFSHDPFVQVAGHDIPRLRRGTTEDVAADAGFRQTKDWPVTDVDSLFVSFSRQSAGINPNEITFDEVRDTKINESNAAGRRRS